VRRGARWALGVGASLIAMAAISGACADVRFIDLDSCSTVCLPPTTDEAAVAEDDSAADIGLSLFGCGGAEGANDARADLILDPKALPPVLVSGLPSLIADLAAQTPDGQGVSPYAFFADVIDSRSFTAVPLFLFIPPLTSQLIWASNDFFGPPSADVASRRAVPLPADADALYGALYGGPRMQTRVTPTLSRSPLSGPPSSAGAKPFGQVGDETGRSAEFSSDGAESNK
jgi:hypothetical protein